MYDWIYYSQVAHGYMCKICEVFYGKSPVPTGRERGAWIHNAVIFHGNAGKKLRRHAKSKPHTNVILTIASTRIDEALLGPSGIQEKTNINEMYVSKLIKIVHFLGKLNLPIKELYPALLHFLAFDLEEPIAEMKAAFSLDNLPVFRAMTCLNPDIIPKENDERFLDYGKNDISTLYDFYGKQKDDIFQGR